MWCLVCSRCAMINRLAAALGAGKLTAAFSPPSRLTTSSCRRLSDRSIVSSKGATSHFQPSPRPPPIYCPIRDLSPAPLSDSVSHYIPLSSHYLHVLTQIGCDVSAVEPILQNQCCLHILYQTT